MVNHLEYQSDHRMLRATISFTFASTRTHSTNEQKPSVSILRHDGPERALYQTKVAEVLERTPETSSSVENEWETFSHALLEAGKETCGTKSSTHANWIDKETTQAIEEKRIAFVQWRKAVCKKSSTIAKTRAHSLHEIYCHTRRIANSKCHKARRKYYNSVCNELERSGKKGNQHEIFAHVKSLAHVHEIPQNKLTPIKNKQGKIVNEPSEKALVLTMHFEELYNIGYPPESMDRVRQSIQEIRAEETSTSIKQQDANNYLNYICPTLHEIQRTVSHLKIRKSAGPDGVYPEHIKYAGNAAILWLTRIISLCWKEGIIPKDWTTSHIVCLPKRTRGLATYEADGYRGISLISVACKILANVLLERINPLINKMLPESQNGFRQNRGTDDAIFTIRRISEEMRRHNTPLYVVYLDLSKAYDRVPREIVWEALANLGVQGPLLKLLQSLYHETKASVRLGDSIGPEFSVTSGVKQGCPLSCTLFNAILGYATKKAFIHKPGVQISWRIPNGRTHRGDKTTGTENIGSIEYADDIALWSDSKIEIQNSVQELCCVLQQWGFEINFAKTKCQVIQPHGIDDRISLNLTLNGKAIMQEAEFKYLGTIITEDTSLDSELEHREQSAWARTRQQKAIWKSSSISRTLKSKIFETCITSRLLYGCATWAITETQIRKLNTAYIRILRSALKLPYVEYDKNDHTNALYISHKKTLDTAGLDNLQIKIDTRTLQFSGHVARMGPERTPNKVLFGNYMKKHARPVKSTAAYENTIRNALTRTGMPTGNTWKYRAQNKVSWKTAIEDYQEGGRKRKRRKIQNNKIQTHKTLKSRYDQGPTDDTTRCQQNKAQNN